MSVHFVCHRVVMDEYNSSWSLTLLRLLCSVLYFIVHLKLCCEVGKLLTGTASGYHVLCFPTLSCKWLRNGKFSESHDCVDISLVLEWQSKWISLVYDMLSNPADDCWLMMCFYCPKLPEVIFCFSSQHKICCLLCHQIHIQETGWYRTTLEHHCGSLCWQQD